MKILFVQVHSGIGGATTSMFQLVRELKKKGHEPEVLITGGQGPLVDWLQNEGVKVQVETGLLSYGHGNGARTPFWSFPPFRPITDLLKLESSVRRYKEIIEMSRADVVYLNTSILWPAGIAAKGANKKVVTHVREVWYQGLFGIRKRFFIGLTQRISDRIVVLSEYSKSQFSRAEMVTVAYNAVDFDRYDQTTEGRISLKGKLGMEPSKLTISMLGGSLPHKGGQVFLKAAAKLLKERDDVQFVVLGNVAPYYPTDKTLKSVLRRWVISDPGRDFQREIDALGLRGHIHTPGSVSNVSEWIGASDLLVFPATTDHFGRPIIEAGYMKVPAVASNTATSRELIPQQRNGLLFENKSPGSLTQTLSALLSDESKRKEMGEAGRGLAEERYSLDRQLSIIMSVLNELHNEE